MRKIPGAALIILAACLLVACASNGPEKAVVLRNVLPQAMPLLRFGVERDGSLSRTTVIAVLKQEFAAADTNHDGVLERDEINTVNDARWKKDGPAASMLIDWNHDGVVDFNEFATTDLSLFDQIDANGDGVVTAGEFEGKKVK
ncbi:MAG: hypothetical protein WCA81_17475 [Rhizomicrobium sp.]